MNILKLVSWNTAYKWKKPTEKKSEFFYFSDIDSIKSSYSTSLLDKTTMRSRKNLTDQFPDSPPDALDMLQSLLQFNPDKRMTAEEALLHPYLAKFHNPSEEHSLPYDVVPPVDDDVQLSVAEYRTKLYDVSWTVLVFTLFSYYIISPRKICFRTRFFLVENISSHKYFH